MMHLYVMRHWFNCSDPDLNEALYDPRVIQEFAGINLKQEATADETRL
jgi:IS5 family transposase